MSDRNHGRRVGGPPESVGSGADLFDSTISGVASPIEPGGTVTVSEGARRIFCLGSVLLGWACVPSGRAPLRGFRSGDCQCPVACDDDHRPRVTECRELNVIRATVAGLAPAEAAPAPVAASVVRAPATAAAHVPEVEVADPLRPRRLRLRPVGDTAVCGHHPSVSAILYQKRHGMVATRAGMRCRVYSGAGGPTHVRAWQPCAAGCSPSGALRRSALATGGNTRLVHVQHDSKRGLHFRERSAGHHPTPAAGHRWLTDDPSIETTCPRRRRWPPKHRAMIRPLRHGGYGARRCVNR